MATEPLDLEAIKAREAAATPGPWWAWDRGVGSHIALGARDDLDEWNRPTRLLPEGMRTDIGRHEDAEFIAHARTDVPAMAAEIERLTAERDVAIEEGNALARILAEVLKTYENVDLYKYAQHVEGGAR